MRELMGRLPEKYDDKKVISSEVALQHKQYIIGYDSALDAVLTVIQKEIDDVRS